MSRPKITTVKSADRVLDLLELLSRKGKAMSHTELAAALAIPKSSLSQLLGNLTARGYLAFTPGSGTYALGPGFFALLRRGRDGVDVAAASEPILERLTATTGESSSFNVYRKDCVERVSGVDSPHVLTYRMTVGTRFMMHSSSAGKAVLAALPPEERERFLSGIRLERRTEATVRTVAELRRQLLRAAREGVAYSEGEHMPGVSAVATAVRRADGYPIGAINVAIPSVRATPALRAICIRALHEARDALERDLS
ncbi:MAG: IclR family transcriptional regulator [Betaproteobacteria bacterium]|nr:IclR family transcriptional regulator [Betaproteobacteria bacterium]